MSYWLSKPIESVLEQSAIADSTPDGSSWAEPENLTFDTLIVGSGYGAAMAALALSEESDVSPRDIVVFERGDEYLPRDFPQTIGDLPGFASSRDGDALTGLWDVRAGTRAVSITGSGLGGTSLVNASVAVDPDSETLDQWPDSGVGSGWHELFSSCYPKIKSLLGVTQISDPDRFEKYRALKAATTAIDPDSEIRAAPVAISFNKAGPHSVNHQPCNHCGNCIIGCHSGAKQSLNLNAWPLAKQKGVELYTGASVIRLEALAGEWRVHCILTNKASTKFTVRARRVILAAGSVGSTEILHRSNKPVGAALDKTTEDTEYLALSEMLGQRFSANGDGLIFSSGQRLRVNAVADVPDDTATNQVGPTIVGYTRTTGKYSDVGKLTIEDGAVPYPMAELWRETVTMQSYINRFVSNRRSAWHKDHAEHDSLAGSDELAQHSQVLLTMGFDGSPGKLVTATSGDHLVPEWPEFPKKGFYAKLDSAFNKADPDKAFDGGEYHPNPVLQLLPAQFSSIFEGADQIPKSVVTVHPLGGCVMGSDIETGVVNNNGQVYKRSATDSTAVYDNLYVLDGSILPTAVGVNPMISISALSYVLASRIAGRHTPRKEPFQNLRAENKEIPTSESATQNNGSAVAARVDRNKTVNARFNERLLWSLKDEKTARARQLTEIQPLFNHLLPEDTRTIILDVAFYFDNDSDEKQEYQNSLDLWLCNPTAPLRARAALTASNKKILHGSADTINPTPVLMEFTGNVILGSRGGDKKPGRFYRPMLSLLRFAYYRPYVATNSLKAVFKRQTSSSESGGFKQKVLGFYRIAKLHSDWRYLEYHFDEITNQTPLNIQGRKKLAFTPRGLSVWESLLNLPTVWTRAGVNSVNTTLAVDLLRITRGPSPLQITQSPDEPTSIAAMAGFGALLARLIGTTHFWSFGAHNYDRFMGEQEFDQRRMKPPPATMSFDAGKKTSLPFEIYWNDNKPPGTKAQSEQDNLSRMVRYRANTSPSPPAVLLVHGLAHSSEIYWPEHVRETYVQFLLSKGYDVWIFDHRTSSNTRKTVDKDHTWDQIARIDVPWAIKTVFDTININNDSEAPRLVNVFAHCIGAGAVAMATLEGKTTRSPDSSLSMVGSLISHAVTPWVFSSCENRTRANTWGFVKDFDLLEILEPRVHNNPQPVDTLLDRIATSTIDSTARKQWPFLKNWFNGTPLSNEFSMAMYFRYTVFWGRQWVHDNVSDKLKKRFTTMVGAVPIAILQQTFFSVRRQRLVSHEADNRYVLENNFETYWSFPTFFLHGQDNQVFDVESSRLSAFRLARFRHENIDPIHPESFSMADYAHHGIWLKTLPNYGHMDMIIGKNASVDVGPAIDKFFKAAVLQNTAWDSAAAVRNTYDLFKENSVPRVPFDVDQPLTRTRASKFPMTGPVLSYATKDRFKLWIETDDYDTEFPVGIAIDTENQNKVSVRLVDSVDKDEFHRGCFWVVEVEDPASITTDITVRVQHQYESENESEADTPGTLANVLTQEPSLQSGSQDLGRQRDINPTQGVVLSLHEMGWFKRMYGRAPTTVNAPVSFLAGSCLHPGSPFSRDLSDSVFRGMWSHIDPSGESDNPVPLDFLLMVGDQIYADATAGLFDPKTSYERHRNRYREAFGARNMRRVMAHLPTYFVVDDHAIRDNYSGLTLEQSNDEASQQLFEVAKAEARNFQTKLNNTGELWSHFEVQDQAFFCFDTRFDRNQAFARSDVRSILSEDQTDCFESWLIKNRNKKSLFLCTGSPLFPIKTDEVRYPALTAQSDTLVSYPGLLEYLVMQLSQHTCENIFVISGDPHLSCWGEGTLSFEGKSVKVVNVVTSALNAPYPFANAQPKDFSWDIDQKVKLPGSALQIEFRQSLLSVCSQQFSRLNYYPESGSLQVKVYASDGSELCAADASSLKAHV